MLCFKRGAEVCLCIHGHTYVHACRPVRAYARKSEGEGGNSGGERRKVGKEWLDSASAR